MNALKVVVMTLALASAVCGVPLASGVDTNEINTADSDFVKSLNSCALQPNSDGIVSCATEKLVRSLDLLASHKDIEIMPGVSLLSNNQMENYRSGKQLKDEIAEAKSSHGSMLQLIGNATARFFSGRTLKVKLPSSEDIGRALEEGRKKMGGGSNKRKGGMSMGIMGMGAAIAGLIPLFLGKIALIAGAALLIGKVALVLSAILLVQMLNKGRNNSDHQLTAEATWSVAPQVSYGPPSNSYGPPSNSYGAPSPQYPYSRSFNTAEDQAKYSQQLAYSEQRKR
ncbi:uncharacterized protein [Euwallacea fornicatus]|uniref:uncharacterized protein isoform X2 n=1 Tax=Euwallacea fornicatus TaxID=995702 RepID=UPI00338D5365